MSLCSVLWLVSTIVPLVKLRVRECDCLLLGRRSCNVGKTYKPAGPSFYACAQERLLQITPWKYHYEKDPLLISRPMCMVMNELSRLISGQEDDWWRE